MTARRISAADVHIGEKLPELRISITAQQIISGAAATRDWQPIHHDHEIATKSGLRGIILNAPSQAGWISKYITDWTGPYAQIKRLSFKMKDSICPQDEMNLTGEIIGKQVNGDSALITANITVAVGEKIKTTAEIRFNVPA